MEKVTIVMLSGGVDSTGALYRLLKETDNYIIAHHIDFVNRENRAGVERVVCDRVVKWLQENVRSFDYTQSSWVWPFPHIGWDVINTMYFGGLLAKSFVGPDREVSLGIGDTKDDFGAYQWKSPLAQAIGLIAALEDPRKPRQFTPVIVQPIIDLTKKEIVEMIPPELFELTWSCRKPIIEGSTTRTCGECSACNDLKAIGQYQSKQIEVPTFTIAF